MNNLENPFGKKWENSNSKDLDNLISDLELYDKEHGSGTSMGQIFAGAMFKAAEDEESLENLRKKAEGRITINDLLKRHAKTLEKMGLSLESPNKKGDVDENETYVIGKIEIDIADKDVFVNFLQSINKDKISASQKKILEMIGEKLSLQFQTKYNFGELDESLFELLSGLKEIIKEYNRLGINAGMTELNDYLAHANSGYLREYVDAKNNKLFEPIGRGFNLSTYQTDTTDERYKKKWDENFFMTLEKIRKNPQAKDLYERALEYGQKCLEFALADKKIDGYDENYKKQIKKAISETKDKLDQYTKDNPWE
jgi:hypothetical protein